LEALVNNTATGIDLNPYASIGYYRQDFSNLDFNRTVLDSLHRAAAGKHSEEEIRKTAANFLLKGDIVKQQIRTLSEGQKGLVSMACIVLQQPAILIMDEPSNHINFRHLPAIVKAVNEFEGAAIVVSHDHDFVSKMNIHEVVDLAELL
jgi:ATPase subunit of ABC transporter with duplicated ATPase domains